MAVCAKVLILVITMFMMNLIHTEGQKSVFDLERQKPVYDLGRGHPKKQLSHPSNSFVVQTSLPRKGMGGRKHIIVGKRSNRQKIERALAKDSAYWSKNREKRSDGIKETEDNLQLVDSPHPRASGLNKRATRVQYIPFQGERAEDGRSMYISFKPTKVLVSNCFHNDTYVNCSSRHLHSVPNDTFSNKIVEFNLYNNAIETVHNYTFDRYSLLTTLNLSRNNISVLESFAFVGLNNLKYLDLWHNKLVMTAGRFPHDLFKPLISLKILWINKNTPQSMLNHTDIVYPEKALSSLTSLKTLFMDGITSRDLGPGFGKMKQLSSLIMSGFSGYCRLHSLTNNTFKYVPELEYLALDNCVLFGNKLEPGAFSPLKKLTYLDINHNDYIGPLFLDRIFYGLHNTTTLKQLRMKNVVSSHSIGICLDHSYISHFPQHLEYLDAGSNVLEGVDRKVIGMLSPSLETLDVTENAFAFGTYLKDLPKMKNLRTLRYNGGDIIHDLPKGYPSDYKPYNYKNSDSDCNLYENLDSDDSENTSFVIHLPPNLRNMEMNVAGLRFIVTELTIDPNNSLQSLGLWGNDFPRLIGPINGLNSLINLTLMWNNIVYISDDFFKGMGSLKTLELGSNLLGNFFAKSEHCDVFSYLQSLELLNLTFNDLTQFPTNTFADLVNLKTLLISKNPLTTFSVNISQLNRLEYLDLTDTRLNFLPPCITNHIDALGRSATVYLSLAKSPVACDCENIHFLQWLTASQVGLRYPEEYQCFYPDSSFKRISDRYAVTMKLLNHECRSHTVVFFISTSSTLALVCGIVCLIVYRFRWKLRYLYYAAYVHYKRGSKTSGDHFKYDVFVSYATEDEDFVINTLSPELEGRGLTLCIHGRDFVAGEYIASNVVKAVCQSRRTVVVLTRDMMKSYWCGYEIQMANMESIHTGRRVLIFLLMEEIPHSELGVELLYNIRNNTYIPYPNPPTDRDSMARLWDKLVNDITD